MSDKVTATRCQCSAITVEDEENGVINSMKRATFRIHFPGMRTVRGVEYGSCNHCVNHYGIDICGCGSGKPVGKCRNNYRECRAKVASETLGVRRPSAVESMAARGGW